MRSTTTISATPISATATAGNAAPPLYRALLAGLTLVWLIASMAQPVWAEKYYKWVDKNGITHYSTTPPKNQDKNQSEEVRIYSKPSSDNADAHQRLEQSRQALRDSMGDREKSRPRELTEEEAIQRQKMEGNCTVANNNLQQLNQSARIRELQANGEYRYLADEEKQARIKTNQEYLDTHCQ